MVYFKMYSKEYTKADVKILPNVLTSNPHLLNANHAKLCAVESKMNRDENQAQVEKSKAIYSQQ